MSSAAGGHADDAAATRSPDGSPESADVGESLIAAAAATTAVVAESGISTKQCVFPVFIRHIKLLAFLQDADEDATSRADGDANARRE